MSLLSHALAHPKLPQRSSDYIRWYPKSLTPGDSLAAVETAAVTGVYIHVPFCDRICHFCPFNKVMTNRGMIGAFVKAAQTEIQLLSSHLDGGPISFVYFGGGTPSVLAPADVASLMSVLNDVWRLAADCEVTLETHPTHAHAASLRQFRAVGVTRISLGVQSFQGELLSHLRATHAEQESFAGLENGRAVFDNVGIDLLYNYHPQNRRKWEVDLSTAFERGATHLSCYPLVAINSALQNLGIDEELAMFCMATDMARARGMEHYASCASGGMDLAASDLRCRYEVRHWGAPQAEFVGIGPGAFGYVGGHATVNGLSLQRYLNLLQLGVLPLASATPVSPSESQHRYFALGVKVHTVPFAPFAEMFDVDPRQQFRMEIESLVHSDLAEVSANELRLTDIGRMFVDTCSATFFSDRERQIPHPEEPEIRRAENAMRA